MQNPNAPVRPYLAIGTDGVVSLCETDNAWQYARVIALARGYFDGVTAFDARGSRWRVAEVITPYRINGFRRFLAHVCFNPRLKIEVRWEITGEFELQELQSALKRAVDADDIMTQFISTEALTAKIDGASTFDALARVLRKHVSVT